MANKQFVQRYRLSAFWVLTGGALLICAAIMLPFLPALLWALVLSVLTYPMFRRLQTRFEKTKLLGGSRAGTVASLTTVVTTILIFLVPFLVVGVAIFAQLGGVSSTLTTETGRPSFESALAQVDTVVKPFVDKVGGDFSVKEYVLSHKEEITQGLRAPVTKFAGQAGFTILTIVIALLSMFFMLRDGENLRKPALELSPIPAEKTNEILHRVGETIHAVFIGTVLVALLQGLLMGIVLTCVQVPSALLLGVATAVLGLIPLVGPPFIFIPVGVFLMAQGKTTEGWIVLGSGFLVISQVDNFLRPFLIGGRVNLHPLAIFFSILGCVLFIGPVGVMAGPVMLTILLALVEVTRTWLNQEPETAEAS
jgi:predicted PurR-regulated permease PerM